MSSRARREIQLLLLAILLALILLALLIILLPPRVRAPAPASQAAVDEPEETVSPEEQTTREQETPRPVPPAEAVVRELLERTDLIPFEGTLGGRMGFYTRENITVLNDRWVFARFEDGHVQGSMLLEYRITPEGELEWTLLAAKLD